MGNRRSFCCSFWYS